MADQYLQLSDVVTVTILSAIITCDFSVFFMPFFYNGDKSVSTVSCVMDIIWFLFNTDHYRKAYRYL